MLFIAMMGVVGVNATSMALLQCKVPADIQGRVFAISTQLALVLTPLGYLSIGPLADSVFTPLADSSAWENGPLGLLFGVGAAGGMGAMFTISSGLALVITLITYTLPSVRDMEAQLPTYRNTADILTPRKSENRVLMTHTLIFQYKNGLARSSKYSGGLCVGYATQPAAAE